MSPRAQERQAAAIRSRGSVTASGLTDSLGKHIVRFAGDLSRLIFEYSSGAFWKISFGVCLSQKHPSYPQRRYNILRR